MYTIYIYIPAEIKFVLRSHLLEVFVSKLWLRGSRPEELMLEMLVNPQALAASGKLVGTMKTCYLSDMGQCVV